MIEEQDDAERRDDLVERIAFVKMTEDKELEQQAERQRREQRQDTSGAPSRIKRPTRDHIRFIPLKKFPDRPLGLTY